MIKTHEELNKYEKLTEPHKMISNIFKNIGAGIEAGKKPADKAIEDYEAKFDKTRVEKKTSNKLLKAMLRDLKKENKELKRKLRRFDEIFNNFESKRKEINNKKERP